MSKHVLALQELLWEDIQEYRMLRFADASASSGSHDQNEIYQYQNDLQHTVDEIRAGSGRLEAKMSELAEDTMAADDGVINTLDVAVTMRMAVRGDNPDTPRQACVSPVVTTVSRIRRPHG